MWISNLYGFQILHLDTFFFCVKIFQLHKFQLIPILDRDEEKEREREEGRKRETRDERKDEDEMLETKFT